MSTINSTVTYLVDSGIGPLSVTTNILSAYDIDDFVHDSVIAQCIKLQLINAIQAANPSLAVDRPPLNIDGNKIGGY